MISSSKENKYQQDELYETWKSLAPYRKNDCIDIASQLRELSDKNIEFDERLSAAVNIIFTKLNLYYVMIFYVEDEYAVLCAGAGIHIQSALSRKEKRRIESRGVEEDDVFQMLADCFASILATRG